ncbi:MAG: hypothetical protein WDN06_03960 [Asticcacaulis sp.]
MVGKLAQVGVERYHTDLQRAEKTFYLPDGQSVVVHTKAIEAKVAPAFQLCRRRSSGTHHPEG